MRLPRHLALSTMLQSLVIVALLMGSLHRARAADADAQIWRSYVLNPDAHPNIANFSFAGYAYGEKPLPEPPVVVKATDFGAVGDGKTDATQAINDALEAAAKAGGGAVLLPAGTYAISGVLWIHGNGVVLRGEGSDNTRLLCARPLRDALGPNDWGGKSAWSWSGGMVWIVPREVRSSQQSPQSRRTEGWRDAGELTRITADARRGDRQLTVADGNRLAPGQRVILEIRDPGDASLLKHLSGDVPGTATYDWKTKAAGLMREPVWRWPVEIVAVEAGRVTLRQPLRADALDKWQPRLLAMGPLVRDSGVERLTIQMAPARLSAHLLNPGWNGVCFENAWDCWARDVVVRDVDNGLGAIASKCVTFDGFRVEGRDWHHATYARVETHDCLWTRFAVDAPGHHGLNVEGLASGNVWSFGTMKHGTFDSHRALPFENLRTAIRIFNDGAHGGAEGAGPLFGARCCHWNIEVLNGQAAMIHTENMMPRGAVVGVRGAATFSKPYPDFAGDLHSVVEASGQTVTPANLHLAQLELRTGRQPLHLGEPVKVTLLRTDGRSIRVTWAQTYMTNRRYHVSRRAGNDKAWNDALAVVDGPASQFEDTDIAPGQFYAYRVRPVIDGVPGEWSPEAQMRNEPRRLEDVLAAEIPAQGTPSTPLHGEAWRGGGVRLTWSPGGETGGTIAIERRDVTDPRSPTEWTRLDLPLAATDTTALDASVEPGRRYEYRLRVSNASGSSPIAEASAVTRAAGTMVLRESFDTSRSAPLPAQSDGRDSLGQWRGTESHPQHAPTLRDTPGAPATPPNPPGELAWHNVPTTASSFVFTQDIAGDFSGLGAAVTLDLSVGNSRGHNAHQLALALRLSDGQWIVAAGHIPGSMRGWYVYRCDISDARWSSFDAQTHKTGAAVPAPGLSKVTGLGIYITRPINNRDLTLDNVVVWARDLHRR